MSWGFGFWFWHKKVLQVLIYSPSNGDGFMDANPSLHHWTNVHWCKGQYLFVKGNLHFQDLAGCTSEHFTNAKELVLRALLCNVKQACPPFLKYSQRKKRTAQDHTVGLWQSHPWNQAQSHWAFLPRPPFLKVKTKIPFYSYIRGTNCENSCWHYSWLNHC